MSRGRRLVEAIEREHCRATAAILARHGTVGPHQADGPAVEDAAAPTAPDRRSDVAVLPHSWLE